MEYSEVRYLLSKKPVDDRALNLQLIQRLKTLLQNLGTRPLEILELGAGVGTMVPRLVQWGVISNANFTLLDRDSTSLDAAKAQLQRWHPHTEENGLLRFDDENLNLSVRFVHEDALQHLQTPTHQGLYDLVTANAVLDLMDLDPALRRIWTALKPEGLFWFTINFDGETLLLPELPLDDQVARLYHMDMDQRQIDGKPAGDSKTGRHLLEAIPRTGGSLEAAGSSDWVVFPKQGRYPGDEGYFLHHIIHTIELALTDHPELNTEDFGMWVETRKAQIEHAELIYIAHQLDVLGHGPTATGR